MTLLSKVAIIKEDVYQYFTEVPFRPSQLYPEAPFTDISVNTNRIYDMVRNGFYTIGYDIENFNTDHWNPLGDYINPGDTVVVKPNMVMEENHIKKNGTDCLYTQPSIVAAVLDYVVIALKGCGKIIVGDAPMQECKFEQLIEESGYRQLIEYLKKKLKKTEIIISLIDFRELRTIPKNGISYSVVERYKYSGDGAIVVDLGEDSLFAGLENFYYDNIRITNYDSSILKEHHNNIKNEYKVCKEILSADVIINMPKPKTHRKGGVTIALKNLIGINSRKEYLPHHTNGAIKDGGDSYKHSSIIKKSLDIFLDKRNAAMQTEKSYTKAKIYHQFVRICVVLKSVFKKDSYYEGSWYGNDTISRTITDLNRILFYADKNGKMCETKQRKALIIADMIISGEKEGPVCPTAKNVGIIAFGENPVCFDEAIATLMGAKLEYINTTKQARNIKDKYQIVSPDESAYILSNKKEYNNKSLSDISEKDLLYFEPTSGWIPAFKKRK